MGSKSHPLPESTKLFNLSLLQGKTLTTSPSLIPSTPLRRLNIYQNQPKGNRFPHLSFPIESSCSNMIITVLFWSSLWPKTSQMTTSSILMKSITCMIGTEPNLHRKSWKENSLHTRSESGSFWLKKSFWGTRGNGRMSIRFSWKTSL